jgi:hypothetical protein
MEFNRQPLDDMKMALRCLGDLDNFYGAIR